MSKETRHIVSFSGGMGSFAEAKSCVDKYGKENVTLLFADVLMEDEDLYRFVNEVVAFLDVKLIKLCYGLTPWQLFEKHKFVGNSRLDLCSSKLKRELLNGYIIKNYSKTINVSMGDHIRDIHGNPIMIDKEVPDNVEVHLGIDYSEAHRLKVTQERMKPWVYRSTLIEEGRIIPKDFSEKFGIKRPRLYNMGFGHNNCGGFCVKAGLGHFKVLYEQMPDRYKEHEETEQRLAKECNTKPFLKKTINGKVHYLTMKEYRENFLEKGKAEEDKWDIGGCACALP